MKKKYILADTRAVYNGLTRLSFCTEKSTIDYFVDKWAAWLMLCYFGNFGGSNPPLPTQHISKPPFPHPRRVTHATLVSSRLHPLRQHLFRSDNTSMYGA